MALHAAQHLSLCCMSHSCLVNFYKELFASFEEGEKAKNAIMDLKFSNPCRCMSWMNAKKH